MAENESHIKLEVDMEPLKVAFDNVAEGFSDHGRAIRRLKLSNIVLASLLILNYLGDILL